MAGTKMGSCKNLERSSRQKNHNQAIRLHKIAQARKHHLKNALQSCGVEFAQALERYYDMRPVSSIGKRAGKH